MGKEKGLTKEREREETGCAGRSYRRGNRRGNRGTGRQGVDMWMTCERALGREERRQDKWRDQTGDESTGEKG